MTERVKNTPDVDSSGVGEYLLKERESRRLLNDLALYGVKRAVLAKLVRTDEKTLSAYLTGRVPVPSGKLAIVRKVISEAAAEFVPTESEEIPDARLTELLDGCVSKDPAVRRRVEEEYYVDEDMATFMAERCRSVEDCDLALKKRFGGSRSFSSLAAVNGSVSRYDTV